MTKTKQEKKFENKEYYLDMDEYELKRKISKLFMFIKIMSW